MDGVFNRVARRRRSGQRGFTLIELLVVIAVLAILAAIVIFNVVGVANRGKTAACQTDLKSIQTAVDAYYNDHTAYPTTGGAVPNPLIAADVAGTYIHATAAQVTANTGVVSIA